MPYREETVEGQRVGVLEIGPEEVRQADERIAAEWAQLTNNGELDSSVADAQKLISDLQETLRGRYRLSGRSMRAFSEAAALVAADVKCLVVTRHRYPTARWA